LWVRMPAATANAWCFVSFVVRGLGSYWSLFVEFSETIWIFRKSIFWNKCLHFFLKWQSQTMHIKLPTIHRYDSPSSVWSSGKKLSKFFDLVAEWYM
jgi:hypothetical protein